MGPNISKIRGFKIWPHNSILIRFDPLFGQKLSKIGKMSDLTNFPVFFPRGEGQILSDFYSEARFGTLSPS